MPCAYQSSKHHSACDVTSLRTWPHGSDAHCLYMHCKTCVMKECAYRPCWVCILAQWFLSQPGHMRSFGLACLAAKLCSQVIAVANLLHFVACCRPMETHWLLEPQESPVPLPIPLGTFTGMTPEHAAGSNAGSVPGVRGSEGGSSIGTSERGSYVRHSSAHGCIALPHQASPTMSEAGKGRRTSLLGMLGRTAAKTQGVSTSGELEASRV